MLRTCRHPVVLNEDIFKIMRRFFPTFPEADVFQETKT